MNIEKIPKKEIKGLEKKIAVENAKKEIKYYEENNYAKENLLGNKVIYYKGTEAILIDKNTGEKTTKKFPLEEQGGTFNKKPTGDRRKDRQNENLTGPTETDYGATYGQGAL